LKEWTVSRVSLAVIIGTGIGIVEIIGLPHQNTTTCETLGGYYVAQSIGRNRALCYSSELEADLVQERNV
jgi:hypothetical protein